MPRRIGAFILAVPLSAFGPRSVGLSPNLGQSPINQAAVGGQSHRLTSGGKPKPRQPRTFYKPPSLAASPSVMSDL